AWIVDNLEANGYVSHNPIVDITNFVMLETGQPSHAYDADKITAPLTVRFAKKGEKLTTLDDIERTLSIEDLVVCDAAGPIGLAGVMGSAHTQITATTKRIVLEAAQFDKSVVRKMAMRHGLRTEASARFERGLPLPLCRFAFARLLDLINQYCEGQIIDGPFDQLYGWPWQQFLGVRLKEAEKVLGVKIDESEVVKGLRRMGFGVEHFSLAQEVKKHLGKSYTWGANFRQHGETTFDCSYLIDRIYSKLGVNVGHTALGQYFHGKEVAIENLKPGDVLFTERNSDRPVSNHYYTTLLDGSKEKHTIKNPPLVGHNGIYIGNNKIVHAGSHYEKKRNRWEKTGREEVCIIPLEVYLENPGFIGARRYLDSLNHILAIEVPWWRSDIRREVDIIEEIAKIIGYDNLSPTLPDIPPMPKTSQSELLDIMAMRDRLVDIGGIEIATYSFISAQDVALSGSDNKRLLRISNPRSPEQAYLRSTLMTSHLHMFAANRQAKSDAVCFEMSRVFERQTGKSQPKERWVLGISSVGPKALENVQAFLHRMLERYHSSFIIKNQSNDERFIAQRSAEIVHDNKKIGVIGQVRSSIAEAFDLQQSASYCEIELSRFLHSRIVPQLKSIPEHQLITRDISLEVKQNCSWADIKQLLENNPSIFSYQFKDYYRNDDLHKQDSHVYTWSIRLDLGPRPSTAIIEAAIEKLIKLLLSSLPAGSNPKIR
ncbi:C40 family peptidase, partial [Candidatus Saccharibacteria bacterium]|nr:C40 family peptidase [Candidatus Saccharibacteria bacterium]